MDVAGIFEVFGGALAATLIILFLLWWPTTTVAGGKYARGLNRSKAKWQARNEVRKLLLQAAGGILVAGTLAASAVAAVQAYRAFEVQRDVGYKTFELQREVEITDRYTKAVDQLGNKDPSVRAAAIFALARISEDSERDRDTIIQTIATFARTNSQHPTPQEKEERQQKVDRPHADIEAAIIALGRRNMQGEKHRLLLDYIYLPNANIRALNLPKTRFHQANLAGLDATGASTNLRNVDLSEAELTCAKFSWSDISSIEPQGKNLAHRTNLQSATLVGADLRHAKLWGALLSGATLDYAHLEGADLSDAKDLRASQLARTFIDKATQLPKGVEKFKPYTGRDYQCWNQSRIPNPVNLPALRDP
ncbi:pentapeptide repeat-containing protein [Streptomyces sioyaensis]|uniref:pentapeptide repeat-containing protein n=1 Tax=Streptomyces sioyaensis TaxID=67364 RepID=UPI003690B652